VDTVFLETNTDDDPDEHGNTPSVRDVLHQGTDGSDPGRWELSGWRVGPDARNALGNGESFCTSPGQLDPMTTAIYRASGIRSELLLPITTEGRWVGSVGFATSDAQRLWAADEEQLLRFAAEMIGAYWERRENEARLEEMVRSKDEFIASVSHEVRTPLTAVLGFAHELNDHAAKFSKEELADLIGLIAMESEEVANIVDDLLIAARAEAGTVVIVSQDVSVRSVVGDVLSSHSGRVDFSTSSGEDATVWADPGRVRQVLRNLLTNAERYGGDIVKIHVKKVGAQVIVEVRDNGEGIPLRKRHLIFEPYTRAERGSREPDSVGLGLSVARKLAELMDGTLELSRDSGWTVFSLGLPASRVDLREPVATQPVGTPELQAG
jgi:signal transduction histidine kinase